MTSQRIIFGQPQEPILPLEQLPPAELLAGGGIRPQGPFQVYFVKGVHDAILAHINETPHIESGGILVGQAFRTRDRTTVFIIITAAIRQDSDNRSVGHFTVGPKEVQEARATLEANYPGYVVVGWYHSHPGHGVFLSFQDMTIVRSIYNASWQLALVVDPQRRTEGIFVGPEGRLLGRPGNQPYGSSWTELHRPPAGVAARAYFNQAQEASESGRRSLAMGALGSLQAMLKDSPELRHWSNEYPGLDELRRRIDGMTTDLPEAEQRTTYRPPTAGSARPSATSSGTERPATPSRGRSLSAGFALVALVVVGYFLVVLLSLRQQALTPALIAWGSGLTLLIGLGALMLLRRDRGRPEHALGYALLASVLLVWGGFAALAAGRAGGEATPPPAATVVEPTAAPSPTPAVSPSSTATAAPSSPTFAPTTATAPAANDQPHAP